MGVMPRKLGVNDPLVKQIRNGDIVERLIDRGDGYFAWLQRKSGLDGPLSSLLAETEFVNSCGNDEILMEKAKEELRRRYAEEVLEDDCVSDKEIETVNKSVRGPVCLFEVILCLAISINEMFEDLDAYDGPAHFFAILMKNCGLDLYDEEDFDTHSLMVKTYWDIHIKKIRTTLFPGCNAADSLWNQMNSWVDQHTNEDGEWVD